MVRDGFGCIYTAIIAMSTQATKVLPNSRGKMTYMNYTDKLEQLTAELIGKGYSSEQAASMAEDRVMHDESIAAGQIFENLDANVLPALWRQAFGFGAERLVLELVANDPSRVTELFTAYVQRNDFQIHEIKAPPLEPLPYKKYPSKDDQAAIRMLIPGLRICNLPVDELGEVWTQAFAARRRRLVIDVRWDSVSQDTLQVKVLEVEDSDQASLN